MEYFLKALKYFIFLCVLCLILLVIMHYYTFDKRLPLSIADRISLLFQTPRGKLLPWVLIGAAAFYPKFGFTTRRIEGDVEEDRKQIINAMKLSGFELEKEEDECLIFRADSLLKRLMMRGDDQICISQYGQWIVIEGIRRGVARATYRLEGYLESKKRK